MNVQALRKNITGALRQNLKPGLLLQSIALVIVLTYFFAPASHVVFGWLGEMKATYGWKFGAISTSLFGGAIPWLFLLAAGRLGERKLAELVFLSVFWAEKGVEVFFLYDYQAELFGTELTFATIAKKTAVDQFIFSALWAAPTISIAYLWKNSGYSFGKWSKALNRDFFTIQMPTIIVSNWLVWLPAIAIIYCLPVDVQLPVANVIQCFWVLLLASLNK